MCSWAYLIAVDFLLIQPIQASSIVIIHPGSTNLRLGRAADAFPHTVPHCIARRHKHPAKQTRYEDTWLTRTDSTVSYLMLNFGLKQFTYMLSHYIILT